MKNLSWFVFFLVLAVSCLDDPDCFQLHNNVLGVTFRVMGTGQADSVMLKNFSTTAEFTPVVSFSYQLNYFKEEDVLNLEGIHGVNLLSFGYTVKNQFISEECGSRFALSDLRILGHDFDSVRIINATPTKTGGTNIEIYRCPETDTLTIDFSQLSATTNGVTITNKNAAFTSHPFDSIITDAAGSVFSGRAATVKLPVNLTHNETSFFFKTSSSQDTLTVRYNLVTEQRYRPCGIQTFVSDLTVRKHTFDSLSYGFNTDDEPARALQDPQTANLRVFDCPKTNLLQIAFKTSADASKTVTIDSITADHFATNLLDKPHINNSVIVPVDLDADASTFYFKYADGRTDTLRVLYTRSPLRLFNACKDPVIVSLQEATDSPTVEVVQNRTILQFPPVTNVEITVP